MKQGLEECEEELVHYLCVCVCLGVVDVFIFV